MEHRALASLIIRIAGLLVIVSAITNAARYFGPFFYADATQKVGVAVVLLSVFISVVMPVLLGLLLVYFPGTTTTRVLRIEGLEAGDENNTKPLQRVAFGAIGMWLAAYALIDSVYVYARTRLYFRMLEEMPSYAKLPAMNADDFGNLVASALQLIIGIWLLLGNRGIVNVLTRLRG
jgi:hypothetical protein